MTRFDVKYKIFAACGGVTKLAVMLNTSPQSVYDVLRSRTTSSKIQTALEGVCEAPISEIRKAWVTPLEKKNISAIINSANTHKSREQIRSDYFAKNAVAV